MKKLLRKLRCSFGHNIPRELLPIMEDGLLLVPLCTRCAVHLAIPYSVESYPIWGQSGAKA